MCFGPVPHTYSTWSCKTGKWSDLPVFLIHASNWKKYRRLLDHEAISKRFGHPPTIDEPERLDYQSSWNSRSKKGPRKPNYFSSGQCSLVQSGPYLENTGMGQCLPSSPKTWRRFFRQPRLKPFLSAPWRNTGERTASERAHGPHQHGSGVFPLPSLQPKPENRQ